MTTATAVALAYVLNQTNNVLPVVGTTSQAHLDELRGAFALQFTPAELAWLENWQTG